MGVLIRSGNKLAPEIGNDTRKEAAHVRRVLLSRRGATFKHRFMAITAMRAQTSVGKLLTSSIKGV